MITSGAKRRLLAVVIGIAGTLASTLSVQAYRAPAPGSLGDTTLGAVTLHPHFNPPMQLPASHSLYLPP